MTPENSHAPPEGARPQAPPSRRPADRSVLALLRAGTRACRLAAALTAVVVGLASQIGNEAVAQATQSRLYLDAPAVSAERASRAGEAANSYSTPGSPASREVLAWLGVSVRPVDVSRPPEGLGEAFASIVARDGEGAGGVTADGAIAAGEAMLAQLEGSPEEDDEDGELASEAVRPRLGDEARPPTSGGTDETEGDQPGDSGTPAGDPGPAYASNGTAYAPVGEPSGGSGVVVPSASPAVEETPEETPEEVPPTELASAPSDTGATPIPDPGTDEETHGPTGPISDPGQAPPILTRLDPEDADDGDEQPYPEESTPTEPAGTEPVVEDTGPTSDEGNERALVPVSPPADGEFAAEEDDSEQAETQAPATPPADEGVPETAYAEPAPSAEETPEDPAESDAPEAASAEVLVTEAGEERVEIVVGGDEAPNQTPSEDEATPEYVPPPEAVPPAEAPPEKEEVDEDASQHQDQPWGAEQEQTPAEEPAGTDTQWGRPAEGDPPDDPQPADDATQVEEPPHDVLSGEPPVEEPSVDEAPEVGPPEVAPSEERPATVEEVSPVVATEATPGAPPPDGVTEASREERQPDVQEQPEGPEYAPSALPGDRAPEDPQERESGDRRRQDLSQDGPRRDGDRRSGADPTDPAEEVEGDGVATQAEQPAFVEEVETPDGIGASESSSVSNARTTTPEPASRAAPQTTEEPVIAEPVPQGIPTPAQAAAEGPAARQYDEPTLQPTPASPASRTGVSAASGPTGTEQAPMQGSPHVNRSRSQKSVEEEAQRIYDE